MISSSSKYALKALLSLAQAEAGEFHRVEDLSRKAGVPGPYLSKLLKQLVKKGLVISRRGIQGGVQLNPKLKKLTFFEVCDALEDPIINKYCFLSKTSCNSSSPCPLHSRWGAIREGLHKFLKESRVL